MGIEAVAVVKISHESLVKAFPSRDGAVRGASGMPLRMTALEDATVVFTPVPFGSEPDEIGLAVRKLLGDQLDAHDDKRGIFVFPTVAHPKARGYAALIDEIGEVGFWVPRVDNNYVPKRVAEAPDGTLAAQLRDLMSTIPSEVISEMEQAMALGDPAVLAQTQARLAGVLATQGNLEQLQRSLVQMFGQGQQPDAASLGLPSEEEAPEFWQQAHDQIEALQKANPEGWEQL